MCVAYANCSILVDVVAMTDEIGIEAANAQLQSGEVMTHGGACCGMYAGLSAGPVLMAKQRGWL